MFNNQLEDAIDYANAPFAKIYITSDGNATALLIPAAGNYNNNYKVGDSLTLQFEPNTDYKFIKWIATPEESVSFDDAENQETTATILNSDESITITPYTVLRDKLSVEFVCQNGTTIPAEKKSYYLNDVFTLSVKPDSDFAFSGFQVINLETNEEDNEIVKIEGTGLDVTVTVLKDNCNAKIIAKTVERPRIVSTTPAYDASGVFRDRKITILFDKLMDDSSIYWTADELTQLGVEVNESYKVNGKKDSNDNLYYYAYDTQNGKVYKNITITKLENDKVNYLCYYGMPEFDKVNPRFLRIPTQKNMEPPASENILVTINSNMLSYNEEVENFVSLGSRYRFSYRTNGSVDYNPPEFTDISFKIGKGSLKADFATANELKVPESDSEYKNYNLNGNKIWVEGKLTDGESGPAKISWVMERIDDPKYKLAPSENEKREGELIKPNFNGNELNFAETIDVKELNLSDGIYKFTITGSDVNENSVTTQEYKFVFDKTPPKAPKVYYGGKNNAVDFVFDLRESIGVYEINVSGADTKTITSPDSNIYHYKFDGKASGQKYSYQVSVTDLCGNSSDSTSVVITAGIRNGMICYAVNDDANSVFCSNEYFNGITLLGVVCDVSEPSKVRVWDTTEHSVTGYLWAAAFYNSYVGEHDSFSPDIKDGLVNYNSAVKYYAGSLLNNKEYVFYYVKNEKNVNSPVVWYIPTYLELNDLISNKQKVNDAFDIVRRSVPQAAIQNGRLVTSTPLKEDNVSYFYTLAEGELSTVEGVDYKFPKVRRDAAFQEGQNMKIHCMAQVDLQ